MAFTPETAIPAQQRSAQARWQRWAAERQRYETVYRVVAEVEDVAPAALETALNAMLRADETMDTVPVDTMLDVKRLAETAEILHRISRLASGQSTANVAHAAMTDDERRDRMAQLRAIAEANQRRDDAANGVTPPTDV